MRFSKLFLAATIASTMWAAELTKPVAEPALWRYARPDAKMLIGLNWHSLAGTEPGKMLKEQLAQAGVTGADDMATLSAIEQVLISTAGNADDKSDPPTVITLGGHFSLEKVRQLALKKKATIRVYKTIEIITPAKAESSDLHVALVNAQTIVLADRKSLLAAIDGGKDAPARSTNALFSHAAALAGRYDLWFSSYAPTPDPKEKSALSVLNNVKVIDGGLSAADKVSIALNLNTGTDAEAGSLATMLNAMIAMAPGDAKAPGSDLVKRVSVQANHSTVKVAFAINAKEIQERAAALAPMMGNMMAGNFDLKAIALPAPPPPTAAKPAPAVMATSTDVADDQPTFKVQVQAKAPEPQFVNIYGLEGGTRRVQIQ